jgi:hypothetical protein
MAGLGFLRDCELGPADWMRTLADSDRSFQMWYKQN